MKSFSSVALLMAILSAGSVIAGPKQLGERCMYDSDCASFECKGFRCVPRPADHVILKKGQDCIFDGDCASNTCRKGTCR